MQLLLVLGMIEPKCSPACSLEVMLGDSVHFV